MPRKLAAILIAVLVLAGPVVSAATAQTATAKPPAAQPRTAKPATAKPATAKPATAKPATARPATAKPVAAPPETAKPATEPPAATAAPSLSTEQQLAFLETAKVVTTRPIGKGVTGALRVTLTDGTLTHDAAFQAIAEDPKLDGKMRVGELRFADHYRYNLAAWRLAVELGLGPMMPPTIERKVRGKTGALSWWVDDVLMDEAEREKQDAQPANPRAFGQQRQRMLVFAELVRDTDRNKGNVVYTSDWRLIMLDFTRAFRLQTPIRNPAVISTCDRKLLAAMRALTRPQLEDVLDDSLTDSELKAVLDRRDVLVEHFDRLVAQRGERAVLY